MVKKKDKKKAARRLRVKAAKLKVARGPQEEAALKAALGLPTDPPGEGRPRPPPHVQQKLDKKLAVLDKVATQRAKAELKLEEKLKRRGPNKKNVARPKGQPRKKLEVVEGPYITSLKGLAAEQAADEAAQREERKRRGEAPEEDEPKPLGKKAEKRRRKLLMEEQERLKAVMNHPSFMADPFTAVRKFLEESVPPPPSEFEQAKRAQRAQPAKRARLAAGPAAQQAQQQGASQEAPDPAQQAKHAKRAQRAAERQAEQQQEREEQELPGDSRQEPAEQQEPQQQQGGKELPEHAQKAKRRRKKQQQQQQQEGEGEQPAGMEAEGLVKEEAGSGEQWEVVKRKKKKKKSAMEQAGDAAAGVKMEED